MSTHVRGTLQFLQNENLRLKQELEDLQEEVVHLRLTLRALRSLQHATMHITAQTDVMKLLERILNSALMSINTNDGSLMLIDEEANELAFTVVHGAVSHALVGHRIPLGTGIAGWVAANKKPVVIADVRRDPRFSSDVDQTFRFQTRSMVCVPITTGQRVLGVIQALNKFEGKPFTDADEQIIGVVAQLAATAILKAEEAMPE